MTSMSKKRKCRNTLYDRGGEKCSLNRHKRFLMYHKKNRAFNKKMCREGEYEC